ncbi:metallophosphoesterase [Sulfurospirillum diekertiae]|uniref:Metallophosphoesterase n=1 Tax=Sulfurospirillum diekertiae TaxID=1854492 RepID=A0A6G9VTI9_9BACT|nr:metallophosphoesterase [Sulfurospirillum diekertiae]QIR75974.1 metallophosphoesterase [Sulfurospirillum diekertiae]QIR78618.1 metallophosphoesterase [Sulfurospirillum diekertiae]
MFRLSFAFAAIAVLSLINFYSYKRFLKRLDLFFKIQGVIKWVMIAITLCEICYFLVLRLDNLDPILYTLFSAMIGVSFMLFCVAILYDLFHIPYAKIPHDYSRRLFIKMVFDVTMLILAFSYIAKGFLNGMKAPRIKEVDVFIDGLESELSIVQITDVHIGKTLGKSFMDAVVKQVNALDADMVVITGDLIDMPVNQIGDKLDSLRAIQSRLGVYYVPGNHEYFYGVHKIMEYVRTLGVHVLSNRSIVINHTINLAGVMDMSGKRFDFEPPDLKRALLHVKPELPTILLSHQPKIVKEMTDEKIDLILSGHTHGGQIFPFGLLVLLDQPYLSGLYQHSKHTQVFVSNGAGFWGPAVRIMAPSEIVKINLKVKKV